MKRPPSLFTDTETVRDKLKRAREAVTPSGLRYTESELGSVNEIISFGEALEEPPKTHGHSFDREGPEGVCVRCGRSARSGGATCRGRKASP